MDYLSKLTAILILINCITFFIRKYKGVRSSQLYCGLFGYSGWDKGNIAKLKILGLYNETRGRDSCGYFFNNNLVKGVDKNKAWKAFIENNTVAGKGTSKLFIGHTRWSTVGANTEENAHPFNVDNKLIIAHNGTINNIWDLCDKYHIDHTPLEVDSLALGHLLNKVGHTILEEYRGYAALLLHRLSEPDTMYVYHGASKLFQASQVLTEERPLFYMSTSEGVYFSSLKDGLLAIRDNDNEKPFELEHNKLFKITNGRFAKKAISIYREYNNVDLEKKTTTYTGGTNKLGSSGTNYTPNYTRPLYERVKASDNNGMGTAVYSVPQSITGLSDSHLDIWNETLPPRCFNSSMDAWDYVYYTQGRHWHQEGNKPCSGILFLDKGGVIYEAVGPKIYERYFFEGILLKGKKEYETILKEIEDKTPSGMCLATKNVGNFAQIMSRYSMYPVTNLKDEGNSEQKEFLRKSWWHDLKAAAGGVTPLWSDRNYVFKAGNLVQVNPNEKRDIIFFGADNNKWANYKIYTNTETPEPIIRAQFEDAEIIEEIKNPKVIQRNLFSYCPEVQSLGKYFDKVFKTMDDIFAECPATVLTALNLYSREILESPLTKRNISEHEVKCYVDAFLQMAINDKVTFREGMQQDMPDPEDYLNDAYMDEISDGDDDNIDRQIEAMEKLHNFPPPVKKKAISEGGGGFLP